MEPTSRSHTSRRAWRLAVTLLVAAVAFASIPEFRGGWVYDDVPTIVHNPAIRHLATAVRSAVSGGGTPVAGRPLLALSLALDFAVSGLNAWSYHLTNALIHGIAAFALFGLMRRTLAARALPAPYFEFQAVECGSERATRSTVVALSVALLWALHPLQTESVTYVAQRAESLMGCCYLLTLYAFARAVDARRPGAWLAASVAACACGMATKEVMVSAPLAVWLYDRTFVSGTFAAAWRRRRGYYASLASTWVIVGALVAANPTRGGTAGFGVAAIWWRYAAVQVRALVTYAKLAIWPHALVFDYGVDRLPLAHATAACALLVGALLTLTLVAVWRRRAAGFIAAAALLILAPTTSILPIVTEPMAEHRMYLPLAAVVVLGGAGAWRLLGRRAALLGLVACPAFLLLTVRRDRDYRSERALWADTVAKVPGNARAHYNLGRLLAASDDLAGARCEYEAALAIRPALPSVRSNLSDVMLRQGDRRGAEQQAREAVRLEPGLAEAHNNLANALLVSGQVPAAADEYRVAVRLEPRNPELHGNLATALTDLNRLPEAVREYEAALRLAPGSARLHFELGNTHARLGRFAEAAREYEAALGLQPDYAPARDNLRRVRALEAARGGGR